MILCARSSAAVESNAVHANAAAGLPLSAAGRLGWVNNSHVLCASALAVLDNAATRAARRSLLAGTSARHAVVELKKTVKFNADLDLGD